MNQKQGFKRIDTEATEPWDTLDRVLHVVFGVALGLFLFPALMWLGALFYPI